MDLWQINCERMLTVLLQKFEQKSIPKTEVLAWESGMPEVLVAKFRKVPKKTVSGFYFRNCYNQMTFKCVVSQPTMIHELFSYYTFI